MPTIPRWGLLSLLWYWTRPETAPRTFLVHACQHLWHVTNLRGLSSVHLRSPCSRSLAPCRVMLAALLALAGSASPFRVRGTLSGWLRTSPLPAMHALSRTAVGAGRGVGDMACPGASQGGKCWHAGCPIVPGKRRAGCQRPASSASSMAMTAWSRPPLALINVFSRWRSRWRSPARSSRDAPR